MKSRITPKRLIGILAVCSFMLITSYFDVIAKIPELPRLLLTLTMWLFTGLSLLWLLKIVNYIERFVSRKVLSLYLVFICYSTIQFIQFFIDDCNIAGMLIVPFMIVITISSFWFLFQFMKYAKTMDD